MICMETWHLCEALKHLVNPQWTPSAPNKINDSHNVGDNLDHARVQPSLSRLYCSKINLQSQLMEQKSFQE